MSFRQKHGEIGYKRPPEHTRWKKRQCGNPKRQYKRVPQGTVAQLWTKEMSGNKRAIAVRLQYQQFVASQGGPREIIVEGGLPDWGTQNE